MKPQPVVRDRKPTYPVKAEVIANPDILMKHVPASWKALVGTGVSGLILVAASLPGCDKMPPSGVKPDAVSPEQGGQGQRVAPLPSSEKAAVVAPLFDHGKGTGVTGCVVMAPPVFLSEEEAIQVIRDEMAKAGVNLSRTEVVMEDVRITPRRESYVKKGDDYKEVKVDDGPAAQVIMDAEDPAERIAVEFVSEDDYFKLGGARSGSTVQGYNFKGIASNLVGEMKAHAKNKTCIVFYEPGNFARTEPSKNALDRVEDRMNAWEKAEQKAKAESKEQLRLQVQDAIHWLRQQGIIQ
jgi:hypothetical protein